MGDEEISQLMDRLIRFFRGMGDDAEDLAQETLRLVVEKRATMRGDNVVVFALGIARKVLCKHLRARRRAFDSERDSVAALDPGPSTILARRRTTRMLDMALRRVCVDHQIALQLFYWDELTTKQIAEVFDVPHSTMRSRMCAARDALSAEMRRLQDHFPLVPQSAED